MQEGRIAIGAKNCFARLNDILECHCNLVAVHSWQHLVRGKTLPPGASYQYRNPVLERATASFGFSPALSRLSADMPRTLLRLTNVGLIDLYQARHSMGLMGNDFLQKAMPPSECSINADADFFRRFLNGQTA